MFTSTFATFTFTSAFEAEGAFVVEAVGDFVAEAAEVFAEAGEGFFDSVEDAHSSAIFLMSIGVVLDRVIIGRGIFSTLTPGRGIGVRNLEQPYK